MNPAETIWGKILITVAGGSILALLGWLGALLAGWLTPTFDPPQVSVQPETIKAVVGQPATVTAVVDPVRLIPSWSFSGDPAEATRQAHCRVRGEAGEAMTCVPFLRGDFTVTARAADENGADSASGTISVSEPRAHLGVLFQPSGNPKEDDELAWQLMHAIDWPTIEKAIGFPIMLYDPENDATIYASMIERNPDVETGALVGRKVLVTAAPDSQMQVLDTALQKVGLHVTFFLPGDREGPSALISGQASTMVGIFATREEYRTLLETLLGTPILDVAAD